MASIRLHSSDTWYLSTYLAGYVEVALDHTAVPSLQTRPISHPLATRRYACVTYMPWRDEHW